MEMRAAEDVGIGQDLTPPLAPLAFCLHDSAISTHCSACFRPLQPSAPPLTTAPSFVNYCSNLCSSLDFPLHSASSELDFFRLLQSPPPFCPITDHSDLRLSLRLLHRFESLGLTPSPGDKLERIGGLLTNREKLMILGEEKVVEDEDDSYDNFERIRNGAKALAWVRRIRDFSVSYDFELLSEEYEVEEAVICLVLTNAVEVQDKDGRPLGIAVYDSCFSWINHSCSPNACYRFSMSSFSGTESLLRISPAATEGGNVAGETELIDKLWRHRFEFAEGYHGHGPRLIVRSVKEVKKGEEILIAYTDLLQPKAARQLELWWRHRFECCCKRCMMYPLTYVDLILQETSAVGFNNPSLAAGDKLCRHELKDMMDCLNDALSQYLSLNNPESCCEKLESLLISGHIYDQPDPIKGKPEQILKLHPLHHVSLNAYTTLASAYRVRATDLTTLDSNNVENQVEAFNMSRLSSAYSLLVAGATHHLFLSETSLVVPAANFLTAAGECLLNLVRFSMANSFLKSRIRVPELFFPSIKCHGCTLLHLLEVDFDSRQSQNVELKDITGQYLNCIASTKTSVWSFLIRGSSCFLNMVEDPFNFGGTARLEDIQVPDTKDDLARSTTKTTVAPCESHEFTSETWVNLYQLAVHTLLYGAFLSRICHGHNFQLGQDFADLL